MEFDFFSVLSLIGGIALFLYGMRVMGDAIGRQAVGRFKTVLENLTASPVKGLVLGTGITAIVQSSSATSVMVLGFVNSGIMTLENSIGLIMGANIGTTATAWILSLNSINGESFILRMLNPDSFVPILAVIGAFILLFSKNERHKDFATIMLGFSVLMYGMDNMSAALKPLTGSEEFRSIITLFSNPIIGVCIGFLITAVTQSSSASVGILQAIAVTGNLPFSTAFPVIVGINIGAILVVLLASVGGNKDARRCALIALLYNIFGAIICVTGYWILDGFFHFGLTDMAMGYVSIAITHTSYKTLIAIIFLPLRHQLIWLSKRLVRDGPAVETSTVPLLDERFLSTPALAVARCRELTETMAVKARDSLFEAVGLISEFDATGAKHVRDVETEIDHYEDTLGSYMVKLSARRMNLSDSHDISRLLHCIGDFERISDHAVNIVRTAEEMEQKNIAFSDEAAEDLRIMYGAVQEVLMLAVDAFAKNDASIATRVEPLEQVVDQLKSALKARHIARLQRGECTILHGFVFSDLITNFERVADHCSNIAICVIQVAKDNFDTHEYLNTLKSSSDASFEALHREYLEKYKLSRS